MNLEEELKTLESQSTMMQNPITNTNEQLNNQVSQATEIPTNNLNTVPMGTPQPQYQQPYNQPAMVNVNQAAQQTANFNFSSLEFDINKPQNDNNSLPRLAGQNGESFRLHILPTPPSRLHTHYNADDGRNFVCLKDAYGTNYEECCSTHGNPRPRNIIPVLMYPTVQGNLNALVPGVIPELKVLIINDKKLDEIKQAAMSVTGKPIDQINLDEVDIIARVDNPQYKSHIFNCTPTTLKGQVAQYIPGLVEKWKQIATPENICRGTANLMTREEYKNNPKYANYDYRKHFNKPNTPTQGAAPNSYTFNTPMAPGGYQQPYGMGGMNQNQPFYNDTSSSTTGFNVNPWQ